MIRKIVYIFSVVVCLTVVCLTGGQNTFGFEDKNSEVSEEDLSLLQELEMIEVFDILEEEDIELLENFDIVENIDQGGGY